MDQDLLSEISKPEKTALVIWDVQKALVDRIFNKDEFLSKTNQLIKAAHEKNIPIFFSKITPLPERFESAPRKFQWRKRPPFPPNGLDLAIVPAQGDIVIPKNTASIFVGTNFELMIRNAGITTILFTGIATEIGVESSVREAQNRGFFAVIAGEAVSSSNKDAHERSLANMNGMFIVMNNAEIIQMWH